MQSPVRNKRCVSQNQIGMPFVFLRLNDIHILWEDHNRSCFLFFFSRRWWNYRGKEIRQCKRTLRPKTASACDKRQVFSFPFTCDSLKWLNYRCLNEEKYSVSAFTCVTQRSDYRSEDTRSFRMFQQGGQAIVPAVTAGRVWRLRNPVTGAFISLFVWFSLRNGNHIIIVVTKIT